MIALQDLGFGYRDGNQIFSALNAEFSSGTVSALVGRSGSGKSTLLYLIGLMLSPSSGSISIDGEDVTKLPDWSRAEVRARLMGFVFQDALLDPARSVLDNILEGALYNRAQTESLRTMALELLNDFGVEVDPSRRPGQISGGQAQRVALCRAFVSSPEIVLADEPTGNLDAESAEVVWKALFQRASLGATVIIATHDRARAKKCHQVIEVGRGAHN